MNEEKKDEEKIDLTDLNDLTDSTDPVESLKEEAKTEEAKTEPVNENDDKELIENEEKSGKKKNGRHTGLKAFLGAMIALLGIFLLLLGFLLWRVETTGSKDLNTLLFGMFQKESPAATLEQTQPTTAVATTTAAPTPVTTTVPATEPTVKATETAAAASSATAAANLDQDAEAMETMAARETDASGALVVPARTDGYFYGEPKFESTFASSGDVILDQANRLAAMYDYDGAAAAIQAVAGYESNQAYANALNGYETKKAALTKWADNTKIPHIFFHSLVVDTSRAFNEQIAISEQDGSCKVDNYNDVMTTVEEFVKILDSMREKGYVLVSIYDMAKMVPNEDGTTTMQYQPIYLPEGKKPFVLSVDDVSYYMYMEGHGFATKLVVGEDGKPTNEYKMTDGSIVYGSYDVPTILDDYVEAHPEFSYRGAKGIIALTGYEGVFGYRTSDFWFNWSCDYFKEDQLAKREKWYYNNENLEADKESAKAVAQCLKNDGWLLASHSWGHYDMGTIGMDHFKWDTDMWEREVEPLLGGNIDILIFPKGADIDSWRGYAADNERFLYLKAAGFNYYCNVDSTQYWVQIGERKDYFRMGRRNLDGYRLWTTISSEIDPAGGAKDLTSDLFDAYSVFDWSRPTPVKHL